VTSSGVERYASAHAASFFINLSRGGFVMLSSRSELADDVCPISDDLLGELHRANDLFVPSFVSTLAPDIRALLALFCYRRSHLHSMGLGPRNSTASSSPTAPS
jgi:hypothetical protein